MLLDSWESTLVARVARGASYATVLSQLSALDIVHSLHFKDNLAAKDIITQHNRRAPLVNTVKSQWWSDG